MIGSAWARVSGAMGIPFVIAYVSILVLTGNSPGDTSSDAKIMDYYGSHSHRVKDLTVFFLVVAGLALLLWFLAHLHSVVSGADGGRAANIALASGTAFVTLFAVAGCAFTAASAVISDAGDKFTLDPNTFRLLNSVGFLAYFVAFVLGSALAFTVGVVAWRTRVLPRWIAVISFIGGLGALGSVVFIPSILYVAWILILSVYLLFRPAGVQTEATSAAAPA